MSKDVVIQTTAFNAEVLAIGEPVIFTAKGTNGFIKIRNRVGIVTKVNKQEIRIDYYCTNSECIKSNTFTIEAFDKGDFAVSPINYKEGNNNENLQDLFTN